MEKFKEIYKKSKTFGDLDEAMHSLSKEEREKLINGLEVVNSATGLDMRQEVLLSSLKNIV